MFEWRKDQVGSLEVTYYWLLVSIVEWSCGGLARCGSVLDPSDADTLYQLEMVLVHQVVEHGAAVTQLLFLSLPSAGVARPREGLRLCNWRRSFRVAVMSGCELLVYAGYFNLS